MSDEFSSQASKPSAGGNVPQQQNPVNGATLDMAKTVVNVVVDTGKKAVKEIKSWFHK